MNPAKAQVKLAIAEEFGREFEKREDDAKKSATRQEGARDTLKAAQKPIGDLGLLMKQEMKEGGLDEIIGEPLKVLEWAMKWNRRAVGALDNLSTKAEVARIGCEGRSQGFKAAKEHAFKMYSAEQSRLVAFAKQGDDADVDDRRSSGQHPGRSLKAQRAAEDAGGEDGAKPPEESPEPTAPKKRPKAAAKRKAPSDKSKQKPPKRAKKKG